jgi:hypothetical protein
MGWMVSITPQPRFTPEERTPGTHCTGGWVGPRAGMDAEVRRKILSLSGIEPRPSSQTLYCLSYPSSRRQSVPQNILFVAATLPLPPRSSHHSLLIKTPPIVCSLNIWKSHSGRAFSGVGSNSAQGMDVCPLSLCVVLSCVGRGLATSWSLVQGVLPYVSYSSRNLLYARRPGS